MSNKLAELVSTCCKSQIKYSENMPSVIKQIDKGSISEYKQLIDAIKDFISSKKNNPTQKVLSLDLFQACMLLNKPDFIQTGETRILPFLAKLATKSAVSLFPDSLDSKENEAGSERFLHKLLNFIFIWANEFNSGSKTSEYAKVFYKLRETITFPDRKIRQNTRSSTIPPSPVAVPKERVTLKSIYAMLEVLETMTRPRETEAGQEMIESLEQAIPDLHAALNKSVSSGDDNVKQKISKVLDRVIKVVGNRASVPVALDKDLINQYINKNVSNSATCRNKSDLSINSPGSLEKSSSFIFPEDEKQENEKLRAIIAQKETSLVLYEETNSNLLKQIKELESNVERLKGLLAEKEAECLEIAKKNNGEKIGAHRSAAGVDFRLALCGKSQGLMESEIIFISFEEKLKGNVLEIKLKLLNLVEWKIAGVDFEVDSAFGFKIEMGCESGSSNIKGFEEYEKVFYIENLCITEMIPVFLVRLQVNGRETQYKFKVPVCICKFSQEILIGVEQILREFELLVFENDSSYFSCEFSLRKCRKLIRLAKNSLIFDRLTLSGLAENQILACFQLSKLVFVLVSVKEIEKSAIVEIRCESMAIRKAVLSIIVNQLK